MHHFDYLESGLHAELVSLSAIAEDVGTPCYVYSSQTITRHVEVLKTAFANTNTLIAYSVKANGNIAILKTLAAMGCGADIVSIGEMRRALHAGIPASKIVFSGVGKTRAELEEATQTGIHTFNVESVPELHMLDEVTQSLGISVNIALRVNPDIAAGGHANISTGKAGDKFGIAWADAISVADRVKAMPKVNLVGLDVHIGSQIADLVPMRKAFDRVIQLRGELQSRGHNITQLDFGGGLGVPYAKNDTPATPAAYADMLKEVTDGFDGQIILEPGRMIMANAGILLTKILYIKPSKDRNFLIVDAGMNDLIRPALYGAHHQIWPVNTPQKNEEMAKFDVVGPVCESTDVFAREVSLPNPKPGDYLAFMSAGAYGAVLSSQYNSRPLVPEVLVNRNKFAIIRKRPSFNDSIALEATPVWMD